jgi:hypothetical protein
LGEKTLPTKYTAGPWERRYGKIVSTVTNDEINHLADDATIEANENLKTMAPELLALLEEAWNSLNYLTPEKFDDAEHEANWNASMAHMLEIIAKAKGEATVTN